MSIQVKNRNPRTIIRPHELQRLVNQLATDIQIRFNPVNERWQVYQVQTSALLQANGNPRVKGIIMWTIEEDNGDYREPMQMDYDRVVKTLENYKLLMKIGADKYADLLDKRDIAREKAINPDAQARLEDGAKQIADLVYNNRTTTHFSSNRASRRAKK